MITLRLIGHIHGRDVISPSLGFRPALPLNMTAWDSVKRWKKLSEYVEKLMLGTVIIIIMYSICKWDESSEWTRAQLTSRVAVVFDVPVSRRITQIGIASYFLLLVAPVLTINSLNIQLTMSAVNWPFRQLLLGGGEDTVLQVVHQLEAMAHCFKNFILLAAFDHHAPHVVGVSSSVLCPFPDR